MSYVDKNMMDGEQVMYRTRRHWIIYYPSILILFLGGALYFSAWLVSSREWVFTPLGQTAFAIAAVIALIVSIPGWINRRTSEFAVTNKRVIVKIGWIRRRSDETLLTKIEGIEVNQGICGRMLNYGTIIVTGTGGSREPFTRIAAPLVFRRKVQEQILAIQNVR